MTTLEIVLLILGIAIFVLSFLCLVETADRI